MVDRTQRPIVPTEHPNEREHRRLLAVRASASLPKDGTEAMTAPLKLMSYTTAALPDATLYEGALVYNSTEDGMQLSNGTSWGDALNYDEGSWTPILTFGGSTTGVTYSTQTGEYTKFGNVCVCTMQITLTSNGTGVGAVLATNLPFASDPDPPDASGTLDVDGGTSITTPYMSIGTGASVISLFQYTASVRTALTDTNVDDNTTLRGTIVYRIA